MKKLMTILGAFLFASVVLTSCGDGSPSACDCAEYEFEMTQESLEWEKEQGIPSPTDDFDAWLEATTTPEAMEHTRKIIEKWEPKTKPCDEKAKADPSFKEEIDECLMGMY